MADPILPVLLSSEILSQAIPIPCHAGYLNRPGLTAINPHASESTPTA